jgi:ATP-dependent Lon protease
VLFPGGLLPLHVFEPRYVAMTRHALATHRTIAIVQLISGELDRYGQPPIASIAGAGTIVEHRETPDGRFNLLLRGEARVDLNELPFLPPYRRAVAEIMVDEPGGVTREDATALLAVAAAFASKVRQRDGEFDFRVPTNASPEKAVDLVAHYLVIDGEARQELLEQLDVKKRTERAIEILSQQQTTMQGRPPSAAN